jgi:hypothetical protein
MMGFPERWIRSHCLCHQKIERNLWIIILVNNKCAHYKIHS